jgi:CheY-like chemotaxis protein
MDWSMPKVAGDQATRTLKTDPRTKHIAVLILTASGEHVRDAVAAAGADALCAKPCGPQELVKIIERLTNDRRQDWGGQGDVVDEATRDT